MSLQILAVCAGNICRSPAAAAAITEAARARGLDVTVDSAGTGAWSLGAPPHPKMVAAGQRAGLEITGRARKINRSDFRRYDIIVVMDQANLRDVTGVAPSLEDRAKIRLLRTFDPSGDEDEIPDPYGGPDAAYDATVAQVKASAEGLIDTLVSVG